MGQSINFIAKPDRRSFEFDHHQPPTKCEFDTEQEQAEFTLRCALPVNLRSQQTRLDYASS